MVKVGINVFLIRRRTLVKYFAAPMNGSRGQGNVHAQVPKAGLRRVRQKGMVKVGINVFKKFRVALQYDI